MSNDSWFTEETEIPQTTGKSSNNVSQFFDLEVGETAEVTFLDLDPDGETIAKPPILDVHKIFSFSGSERYPTYVLCPLKIGESCGICEGLKELDPKSVEQKMKMVKYHCYTVFVKYIDRFNNDGENYPAVKQIRLTTGTQSDALMNRISELQKITKGAMKDVDGVHGHTFNVTRTNENFMPRVGVIKDYMETPDLSKIENMEPFNREELLERFVTDLDQIQDFVNNRFLLASRPVVNRS